MAIPANRGRVPHPKWRWSRGAIVLGATTADGREIVVPEAMLRLGMRLIGLPGQGKSRCLEGILRQIILMLCGTLRGALLIDPHGELFEALVTWITAWGIHRFRRIHILDPSDPRFVFHLNPARRRAGVDPAVVATALTNAILRGVWKGQDPTAYPQIRETLKICIYSICEFGLSLYEAVDLLAIFDDTGLRNYVIQNTRNPIVRQFWRSIEQLPVKTREEKLSGAQRRLNEFLLPERMEQIFSEPEHVLDIRTAMDAGDVILVNLSYGEGRISEDEATLLGTLLLAEVFLACQGRPKGATPFFVVVDECHRFLTEDAAKFYTEGRKFGCHPIYAHQVNEQIEEAGPFIAAAVKSARTTGVFGGLDDVNASATARDICRGVLDLELPKQSFSRPVVVGQERVWMRAESATRGTAQATGTTESHGGSRATQQSTTKSKATTRSEAHTVSESDTVSESHTDSYSESKTDSSTSSSNTSDSSDRGYSATYDFMAFLPRETSRSRGEGTGSAQGESETHSTTVSRGSADTYGTAHTIGTAHTTGSAVTKGTAKTQGTTIGTNWSRGTMATNTVSREQSEGRHQTFQNVFQTLPTHGYSLDELLYLKSAEIAALPVGEAIVKIGARPPERIRTVRIAPALARPEQIARVTARLAQARTYVTPVADLAVRQHTRRRELLTTVREFLALPPQREPETVLELPPFEARWN